jgi:hypothetical protein
MSGRAVHAAGLSAVGNMTAYSSVQLIPVAGDAVHDPLVVAFEIKRPWPARRDERGWRYWPSVVTVWHREPGGADALSVCKHTGHWRVHVHHWKLQFPPLQALRRRLLTRCAWCAGRSVKGDCVNISHQWDGPRGRWWRGEPGLFHHDCSSVSRSHGLCFCAVPVLSQGDYGRCEVCGGSRAWRQEPDEADRLLASLPEGSRITPDIRSQVEAAWAVRRARRAATETQS